MILPSINKSSARLKSAFTLVEILTAMGLLLIMTLGLVLLFHQTQRAFRSGLRQVDVMETARATLDFIGRDVQQMALTANVGTNADIRVQSAVEPVTFAPLVLDPNLNTNNVTNIIQNLYFTTGLNNQIQGVGYRVLNLNLSTALLNKTNNIIVGTLYRFYANTNEVSDNSLYDLFANSPPANLINNAVATNRLFRRMIDGVVHFEARPYDSHGRLFTNDFTFGSPVIATNDPYGLGQTNYTFTTLVTTGGTATSAIPSYLEIELGVMEPHVVEQVKPIVASGDLNAVRHFITNHLGAIHIFRQQIPIRTALR